MRIPDRKYTLREATALGAFSGHTPRPGLFVNIGMHNPADNRNWWWIDWAGANGLAPFVVEPHLETFTSLLEYGLRGECYTLAEYLAHGWCGKESVVLWWHGPEHVEKGEAIEQINDLLSRGVDVILGCPYGDQPQDAVGGNELQRHVSVWTDEDFFGLGMNVAVIDDGQEFCHITAWKFAQ